MTKVALVSIIIVTLYLSLFFQEVYSHQQEIIKSISPEEIIMKEWNIKGEININESFTLFIEGQTVVIEEGYYFEIAGSPNFNNLQNKELSFKITGVLENQRVIINKSVFNNQELVISIEELIILLEEEFVSKEYLDDYSLRDINLDFKWNKFIEIPHGHMVRDIGVQYKAQEFISRWKSIVIITVVQDEVVRLNIKLQDKEKLLFNISLHQSHF